MPLFRREKNKEKLSTPSDASEDINLEGSDPSVTNLEEEGQEEMTENVVVEELQRQLAEAQAQAESYVASNRT